MTEEQPVKIVIRGTAQQVRLQMLGLLGIQLSGAPEQKPAPQIEAKANEPAREPAPEEIKAEEPQKKPRGTRAKKAAKAAPDVKPDAPETQAQDKADEQAESKAAKAANPELTHDDVRNALGLYVTKFGMDAAQKDGQAVLAKLFGDVTLNPDTKQHAISKIPATQGDLQKAVDGFRDLLEKNPFDRSAV